MTDTLSPFAGHLHELRKRVLFSFLAVVLFSTLAYINSEQISRLFMAPLFQAYPALAGLVYTNLTEAFISYIKVSILVGIICSFPILCYEVWMYVSPGLYKQERRLALQVVFWATILFAAGVFFSFFIVLPKALTFLMSFAGDQLEPMPKLDAYLTFVARGTLAFGLAFEIPFLMVVAGKTGLFPLEHFVAKRTKFYLVILVLAFLLTAGDLFSTVLLALPLFGLYESGILVMRLL